MNTLVVIPCFNEGQNLQSVITDLKKAGVKNILVVNDGSGDDTAQVAKKNKVELVNHIVNRGLGAALGTGFAYALKNNYDVLVTFDGDGQHVSSDLPGLLKPIVNNKADVVIGSRFVGKLKKMPIDRLFLNLLSNIMTLCFYGVWASDSQSGLRAFNKKAIGAIKIKTDKMEVSSEFYREIKRNNLRLKEVPIEAIYTEGSLRGSKQEDLAAIKLSFRLFLRLFQ